MKTHSVGFELDFGRTMAWVAQTQGKGRLRQLAEMARLAFGQGAATPDDYFRYALFRPELTAADRRAFLSDTAGRKLNERLSPRMWCSQTGLLGNKVLTGFVLEKAGFPVLPTLALFSMTVDLPGLTMLHSPAALARWLTEAAPFPVFAKPLDGSLGVGGVSILGAGPDGLRFGDGRVVAADVLAADVARRFGHGWMMQPLLRMHPDVVALAGTTAALLRVTTLRTAEGVETLYTTIRLPSKGAMVDSNTGSSENGYALVDPVQGRLIRAQSVWRMNTTPLEHSPATGVLLAGRALADVPAACRLAEAVHAVFPAHGVRGFDIALTVDGPVVVEVKTSPHHVIYQRCADRGLMNPDFQPRDFAPPNERAAGCGPFRPVQGSTDGSGLLQATTAATVCGDDALCRFQIAPPDCGPRPAGMASWLTWQPRRRSRACQKECPSCRQRFRCTGSSSGRRSAGCAQRRASAACAGFSRLRGFAAVAGSHPRITACWVCSGANSGRTGAVPSFRSVKATRSMPASTTGSF